MVPRAVLRGRNQPRAFHRKVRQGLWESRQICRPCSPRKATRHPGNRHAKMAHLAQDPLDLSPSHCTETVIPVRRSCRLKRTDIAVANFVRPRGVYLRSWSRVLGRMGSTSPPLRRLRGVSAVAASLPGFDPPEVLFLVESLHFSSIKTRFLARNVRT